MSSNALSTLAALVGSYTGWIVPFLFTLTIIVFFHELGHFLVARWCGIRVLVFSMGFGPELAGFNDRHGTRWKLSLIPLGGYVKFFGDDNEASVPDPAVLAAMSEEDRKRSFFGQSVGRRAAVVVAGPLTNFILAIVIFAGVFMMFGKPTAVPRVASVEPNSAAAAAGFQPGDLVTAIDGRKIDNFVDMQRIVGFSGSHALTIVVDRGGVPVTLTATPEIKNNRGVLGVTRSNQPGDVKVESVAPLDAVKLGVEKTWFIVDTTLSYIGDVFVGRQSADQIGGPIGIARISGQVAELGWGALFDFVGVISVSIGLLNLFPVPLLDGGHLLFYFIEAVRGRPLSERAQEVGFRIGLAIVVMLMIFATVNDILHLRGS
ncbi:MAG TPA: RIP metalloprotease RseP [Xanthobacteraceae bacterium]|nr:RIP metalloprotease RseP [Xanthobacteraceae bacterium]